ncbi:MAG: exodeoxyribonuclease VII large subunit [Bacteroidetes Order II. Incertae sedis bacterium]|nr:exodeoxyribonuclease VII large subunit [Bacteroidetes Order II. bacterium]
MPEHAIISVSDLNGALKEVVEDTFSDLWVEGEISNFKAHTSGHLYFSLKDYQSQISCALWQFNRKYLFFTPHDGMKVVAHGALSLYPPRGTYSFVVKSLRPAGEGDLNLAFEALKQKLAAEGLFAAHKKQKLPRYPQKIGVITSETGAAIQDILRVIQHRFPMVQVSLIPVMVQGPGAAEEIARAIYQFNAQPTPVDVLLIGRGGGSIEDLWAFNEEVVARAIYHSTIPVISAVGHETDVTIADLVADVRAATPSNAAELATPNQHEALQLIVNLRYTIKIRTLRKLEVEQDRLRNLRGSYALNRPRMMLEEQLRRLIELRRQLLRVAQFQVEHARTSLQFREAQLRQLDPNAPLKRGYVQVYKDQDLLFRANEAHPKQFLTLRFLDGSVAVTVTETRPDR